MSEFIEWTDNLVLGLPEIDDQHLGMTTVLNQLAEAVQLKIGGEYNMGSPPLAVRTPMGEVDREQESAIGTTHYIHQLLDELVRHTCEHFKYEEELMEKLQYSGLSGHKREHTMLVAELASYVKDITRGAEPLEKKTLCALKEWLIVHILESDKAFANHAHKSGG